MSIKIFGPVLRPNQPHNYAWHWIALDVTDVYTAPLTGAQITITSVTLGNPTMIAYTVSGGAFTAGPATLTVFQGYLTNNRLIRGSYRGTASPSPQWPITAFEAAGLAIGQSSPSN